MASAETQRWQAVRGTPGLPPVSAYMWMEGELEERVLSGKDQLVRAPKAVNPDQPSRNSSQVLPSEAVPEHWTSALGLRRASQRKAEANLWMEALVLSQRV